MPTDQPDLFTQLNLQALPLEAKIKLLERLEAAAREQVITLIIEQLDDTACVELDAILQQQASEDDIIAFLRAKIPDLETRVKARIETFKQDLIAEVQSIRSEIDQAQDAITAPNDKSGKQDKQDIKKELVQVEKSLDQALKEGDFAGLTELLHRSRQLKAALQK